MDSDSSLSSIDLEKLNISNDKYYQPVSETQQKTRPPSLREELGIPHYGSATIRHSLPAYDLTRVFYPTYMREKYCNFHRPKLRHFNTGPQARSKLGRIKPQPIKNLSRPLFTFQKKLRSRVFEAINRGWTKEEIKERYSFIHYGKDLTAKLGEIMLFEYVEEYPPVLSQIGMASNVKTMKQPVHYSATSSAKVKANSSQHVSYSATNGALPPCPNSETNRDQHSGNYNIGFEHIVPNNVRNKQLIYFDELKPGTNMQVIENNLYRAPIFQHEMPGTDFLIIRTRNSIYIRPVSIIFTVGQIMPLMPIPKPTLSNIQKFYSDLSNFYIHRLFMQSDTDPPSLDFNVLLKLFPNYNRETLRSRLYSRGAQLKTFGDEKLYFRGSSNYGLLSQHDLRKSFTPEKYCTHMAMLAALDRLRELNYTDTMINPTEDVELETEVLAAPWNTSKAILDAIAGRCYLDLKNHLVDPTGSKTREGFSCIPWIKSPTEYEQLKAQTESSSNLNNQPPPIPPEKNPLRQKITREKLARFAIYQQEARRIADIQASVLRSKEVLSSDEEDESDGLDEENLLDTSFDGQLKDLNKMVIGNKTISDIEFEKEEEERRKLLSWRESNSQVQSNQPHSQQDSDDTVTAESLQNKILCITRTFETPEGRVQATELVREPKIMALYLKEKGFSVKSMQNSKNTSHNQTFPRAGLKRRRNSSISLGPGELSRTDGTVLTISKKVLNPRVMRNFRRQSRA